MISKSKKLSRRQFIASSGAAALSFTILKPGLVTGTTANSKLKLGIIGCGGRGTWIAGLFRDHGGYEIWAAADYFQDRVDNFGGKYDVPETRRFTGLSAYKRLLESGVDAIAVESPPYFHPEQAAAGVEAGVHVYVAKPVAVDVPGSKSIARSGKKASRNKQVFLVDFQTRANEFFINAINRVHAGAIGEFAFGESTYHAEEPFAKWYDLLASDPKNPEYRLRAWGLDLALSGDIITEQNIHTLDVATWIIDQAPIYAVGTGGLTVRRKLGTCWDHYALLYQFPNNVGVTFSSRQFKGHGTSEGIRNRMFGSKGILETRYGGNVLIRGENFYRGGDTSGIYKQGAVNNIATFYHSITNSIFENPTVEPSVRSTLVTILGRTAAREGRQVYWYQIVKSDDRLLPDLRGLKE